MTVMFSASFTPLLKMKKITTKDVALVALMVAIIEVCKVILAPAPNIELTSFLLITFSLFFGKRVYAVVPVFILIEGVIYGFGIWWVMYLYAWPLLILITRVFKKNNSCVFWAVVSGVFGLLFGFMCAIPYIFLSGISGAFSWWIAGIPFDLIHGVSNFLIMLLLYHPIAAVLKKVNI